MRLLEMRLIAFGPFTNVTLDLSGGAEGLHVVHGPNEAGKSSALRALVGLLYGIEERTSDDFVHAMPDLRIGGRIRRSDGTELAFVRRKGRKETLLTPDGRPMDDRALEPFLGGVRRDLFVRMFGLGHDTLVEGGGELLSGGGDVGESLFAAGLGAAGFHKVLQSIEAEADDLFRPRGQKQLVNQAVADFETARRAIREHTLHEQDWRALRDQVQEARRRVEDLGQRIHDLRMRQGNLTRLLRVVPLANRLRECRTALDALGEVRVLPEDFIEKRHEQESALRGAGEAAETAASEVARIEGELAAIEVPAVWLDESDLIDRLKEEVGEYRKHGKDLPKRRADKDRLDREAAAILALVRPDLDLARAAEARPSAPAIRRVRDLIAAREALVHDRDAAQEAIRDARQDLLDAAAEAEGLPPERDPSGLARVLKRVRALGDLEAAAAAALEQSAALRKDCERRAARLSGWTGTSDDLAARPIPDPAVVDRFDQEFAEARRERDSIREDERRCEEEALQARRDLAALEHVGPVPLEDDLERERRHRDEGWAHVRVAWRDRMAPDVVVETYDPDRPLAEAFEAAMKVADEVSDRLRREAERVNRLAGLKADLQRVAEARAALADRARKVEDRLADLDREWTAVWSGVVDEPRDPRDMRGWLSDHRKFREAWDRWNQAAAEAARLQGLVEKTREEVAAALRPLEDGARSDERLSDLIERATERVEGIRKVADRRAHLEDAQRKAQRTLERKEATLRVAEERLADWEAQWTEALARLGIEVQTPPREVEDRIERLERLGAVLDERAGLQSRIEGMERDRNRFEAEVSGLVERLVGHGIPFPEGMDPVETVQWMDRGVAEARALSERRDHLVAERGRQKKALDRANERARSAREGLRELCRQAGCEDPELLPGLEKRSAEARTLEAEVASLRKQIAAESGGRPVDEAIREAEGVDPVAVEAEAGRVEDEFKALEEERTRVAAERGRLEEQLKHLEQGSPAVESAQDAQAALARIRAGVRRYVPLRLAGVILRRAIEDYRRRHQDPLVSRAGEVFGRLTLGAFTGLAPDYGEDDRPVLVGLRRTGERVRVEHMSDGTRDQLYLALRLATVERHVAHDEPMPFVVDDVLIRFDDDRARAGVQVLAELARKTQVILFTHHKRIVELAREAVAGPDLFVRDLGATASRRTG